MSEIVYTTGNLIGIMIGSLPIFVQIWNVEQLCRKNMFVKSIEQLGEGEVE